MCAEEGEDSMPPPQESSLPVIAGTTEGGSL